MCQGQQGSESLGYSPMPINLVEASFDQIRKIPGVVVQDVSIQSCKNPTFSADGHNVLADQAPQPQECDKQGGSQCASGTGGAKKTTTPVKAGTGGSGTSGNSGTAAAAPRGRRPGASRVPARRRQAALPRPARRAQATPARRRTIRSPRTPTTAVVHHFRPRPSPLTLSSNSGWSENQTLIALALLFTLALVFAPAITARVLAKRTPS